MIVAFENLEYELQDFAAIWHPIEIAPEIVIQSTKELLVRDSENLLDLVISMMPESARLAFNAIILIWIEAIKLPTNSANEVN